jgi:ribose-phosphate pyrophosphokinase
MPYFGYARQDRKAKPRDPISAKLVANMIVAAGADRVLTMDLHASQIQGFFDIPVDNLLGNPIFTQYFHQRYEGHEDETIVVSPDVGSVARARAFAQKLGMGLANVDKRRQKANSSEVMNIIGDVRDKKGILFDDMVDTGGLHLRRGPGSGGAGRGHRGHRLRQPRRALRPGYRAHREKRPQGDGVPRHRSRPPRSKV